MKSAFTSVVGGELNGLKNTHIVDVQFNTVTHKGIVDVQFPVTFVTFENASTKV